MEVRYGWGGGRAADLDDVLQGRTVLADFLDFGYGDGVADEDGGVGDLEPVFDVFLDEERRAGAYDDSGPETGAGDFPPFRETGENEDTCRARGDLEGLEQSGYAVGLL